ncbi:hypothetical protein [Roseateles sp.]|jgi:hypothetical protein|uniref:hypothetical protein n=1 Tax=Roseateles sp. TaxID=1971397 RepID=UPI0031CF63A6
MGQTLWTGESEWGSAGVAWDWVRMPYGMVSMVDPLGLVTNMQFLNRAGEVLAPMESAIQLNGIVHMLPWQEQVQLALELRH